MDQRQALLISKDLPTIVLSKTSEYKPLVIKERRIILDHEIVCRTQFLNCAINYEGGGAFLHIWFDGDNKMKIDSQLFQICSDGDSNSFKLKNKQALTDFRFEDCVIIAREIILIGCELIDCSVSHFEVQKENDI